MTLTADEVKQPYTSVSSRRHQPILFSWVAEKTISTQYESDGNAHTDINHHKYDEGKWKRFFIPAQIPVRVTLC